MVQTGVLLHRRFFPGNGQVVDPAIRLRPGHNGRPAKEPRSLRTSHALYKLNTEGRRHPTPASASVNSSHRQQYRASATKMQEAHVLPRETVMHTGHSRQTMQLAETAQRRRLVFTKRNAARRYGGESLQTRALRLVLLRADIRRKRTGIMGKKVGRPRQHLQARAAASRPSAMKHLAMVGERPWEQLRISIGSPAACPGSPDVQVRFSGGHRARHVGWWGDGRRVGVPAVRPLRPVGPGRRFCAFWANPGA